MRKPSEDGLSLWLLGEDSPWVWVDRKKPETAGYKSVRGGLRRRLSGRRDVEAVMCDARCVNADRDVGLHLTLGHHCFLPRTEFLHQIIYATDYILMGMHLVCVR